MLRQQRTDRWVRAGKAPVDAGLIMIGDPCYISNRPDDAPEEQARRDALNPLRDWGTFLDTQVFTGSAGLDPVEEHGAIQVKDTAGHDLAVLIGGFGGDGTYPVFTLKSRGGAVRAAIIVFDDDEVDGDPEIGDVAD